MISNTDRTFYMSGFFCCVKISIFVLTPVSRRFLFIRASCASLETFCTTSCRPAGGDINIVFLVADIFSYNATENNIYVTNDFLT